MRILTRMTLIAIAFATFSSVSVMRAQTAQSQCQSIAEGFAATARTQNPQWATDAAQHTNAVQFIVNAFFNAGNQRGCQAILLATQNPSLFILGFENKIKNLQQAGGGASSSGTTNLVSKSLTSELLSMASEYGGITQSTSGQTTTFSGSLSAIPLTLGSKLGVPFLFECSVSSTKKCLDSKQVAALSRFSFSVGVNTAGGTAGSGMATSGSGTSQPVSLSSTSSSSAYSLNQIVAKAAIFESLPTKSALSGAAAKIDVTILGNQDTAAQALMVYLKVVDTSQVVSVRGPLVAAAEALLAAPDPAATEAAWNLIATQLTTAFNAAVTAELIDNRYGATVATYLQAADALSVAEDNTFASGFKPTLSLEYDYNTPANQPSNSVFKLIGAWTPARWTLTLNGAVSIYDSQPATSIPGATRLRDVQLAAEADLKTKKTWPIFGQPTYTAAFYYQDQTSPSLLTVPISGLPITGLASTTNTVFTQRGPIDIGQLKLSFGSSSSGVSVPLSFTIANRTELLQGMDVKGQIGISYNFNNLLAK